MTVTRATPDSARLAAQLDEAERTRQPIAPLTDSYPDMTADQAYQVQVAWIEQKLAAGARVAGKKTGLTSKVMQQMLGVDQPDFGHLLDDMVLGDGAVLKVSNLIAPRVEAEIGVVLAQDLAGPGVTLPQALSAVAYLVPTLEVIDSRIRDWKIKLADTIADNGSSCRAVVGGKPTPLSAVDPRLIGLVLSKNGEVVATGAGAAALGNPLNAVVWLANALATRGIPLKAGELILPGSLCAAVAAGPGDSFLAEFDHLGSVGVRFV